MAAKRKRGRGLPPTSLGLSKSRLNKSLQRIDNIPPRIPPPRDYGNTMENIRKDADMLLRYADTPEDKLKYVQIIFRVGQMYLWYPWKVGNLPDDKGREHVLGKAMQAEQEQYKYIRVVEKKTTLKQTLDKLGATDLIFKKTNQSGLRIRLPRKKPKPYRDYKSALNRKALAKNKLRKFINLHKMRKKIFIANKTRENKRELTLARERWARANKEYSEARSDLPIKKKAYEEFRANKQAPIAKSFRKYK